MHHILCWAILLTTLNWNQLISNYKYHQIEVVLEALQWIQKVDVYFERSTFVSGLSALVHCLYADYGNDSTISYNPTNTQSTHCLLVCWFHKPINLAVLKRCTFQEMPHVFEVWRGHNTQKIAFLFYLFLQYLTLPKADFNKSLNFKTCFFNVSTTSSTK